MDLIGAEIFDVGTWNGLEFSDDDLDSIVRAFESLGKYHQVPLKLGHNDEQPVTDGQPALGWVKRIYRDGSKLLADFTNMPRAIYEAIKNRLYRTVSVELLGDVSYKGTSYPWLLDAVALLGADQPAVNTLGDLNKLMASRTDFKEVGRRLSFTVARGDLSSKSGGSDMSDELKTELAAMRSQLETFTTRNDELAAELDAAKAANAELKASADAMRRDADEREAAELAQRVSSKRDEVKEIFDRAIKAGSITPAQRESFSKLFRVGDDEAVLELDLDELSSAVNMERADMTITEQGGRAADDRDQGESADEFLLRKTAAYQADHGEDNFEAAFKRVAAKYPDVHREYLNSNGEE